MGQAIGHVGIFLLTELSLDGLFPLALSGRHRCRELWTKPRHGARRLSFRVALAWLPRQSVPACFEGMIMTTRTQNPESFSLDRLTTPIGIALLVTDAQGALRALDWEDYEHRMRELLRLHYGVVELHAERAPADMRAALSGYFEGDLAQLKTIAWRVAGTPFQRKVWTALATIPVGTTLSYGAMAARLDMPKAVRAVGHANGANPISVVLPCHRLIGADGSLVKYGGGLERKRWLLRHEGVRV
jgi:methylated-DNA-[protein]-cysteine S-methyltransferase